jgi:phospholipid/cholesterol/gamma-HCH transport system substrate-binding protein
VSPRGRAVAVVVVALLLASGCSRFKGAQSLPLPGGAAHGKTYHVTAVFPDVQDLAVQAAVRVNDVAVGDVTSITLDKSDLKARVGMKINASVHLPANATATLEQTTLLGEKFVALAAPTTGAPSGRLANGALISAGSSAELPNVEEVFGLLSQVLNGSDLQDLQTINVEVTKALAGRETAVRGALTQLDTFVTGLNSQKRQIVRALDELDRFSTALAKQDGTIDTALTDLGPGLKVLANERAQFTSLLSKLSTFGQVATRVINASRDQTITGLRDLQPILGHLAAAGADLPKSLEILVTFPFPRAASAAAPGDYTNFAASINLSPVLCAALANFSGSALAAILAADHGLLSELGGLDCPTAGTSTVTRSLTADSSTETSTASSSSSPSPASTPSTRPTASPTSTGGSPSPAPSSAGLAGLLNGLVGGGS